MNKKPFYITNPTTGELENTNDPNWTGKPQTNTLANKIVNKSYQQTKNKNPFTQSAEIAKDLLSFEMKDGFIENKDNKRIDTVKEAVEMNEALDKNVLDHKKDDYLNLIESNRLAEKESPKQTWNRLDANEKKRTITSNIPITQELHQNQD